MEDTPWGLGAGARGCPGVLLPWGCALCGGWWLRSHAASVHGAGSGRCFPFSLAAGVCSSCVGGVMLRASETWAMGADGLGRIRRGGRAMVRWVCGVGAKGEVGSDSLLAGLGIQDLDVVLRTGGVWSTAQAGFGKYAG